VEVNVVKERIAILGAGAIGSSIAAYLIRDGRDVILIDQWAAHIEKIRNDGLKLTDLNGEFTVQAKAIQLSDVNNLREMFDIVYLSVKSYDTRWSAYLIEPFLKPTGFIVPAQNSLNDEVVASVVGFNRTVGCVPSISAGIYEPGHVIRTDPLQHCFTVGELSGLITNRVKGVVQALSAVGETEATTNIWGARWSKLVVNAMGNSLAGIVGPSLSSLNEAQRDIYDLIRVVTGSEAVRVGLALGISVEPISKVPAEEFAAATGKDSVTKLKEKMSEIWAKRANPVKDMQKRLGAPGRPSLLQDVMKGRRTEVTYLNGLVVQKGKEVEVPTPLNQFIIDIMLKIENGEIKPDPSNLDVLKAHISF
jgi:2-dehydropantoate 2-reductase